MKTETNTIRWEDATDLVARRGHGDTLLRQECRVDVRLRSALHRHRHLCCRLPLPWRAWESVQSSVLMTTWQVRRRVDCLAALQQENTMQSREMPIKLLILLINWTHLAWGSGSCSTAAGCCSWGLPDPSVPASCRAWVREPGSCREEFLGWRCPVRLRKNMQHGNYM